jgi:hypothetical protein
MVVDAEKVLYIHLLYVLVYDVPVSTSAHHQGLWVGMMAHVCVLLILWRAEGGNDVPSSRFF